MNQQAATGSKQRLPDNADQPLLRVIAAERERIFKVSATLRCIGSVILNDDDANVCSSELHSALQFVQEALDAVASRLEPMCIHERLRMQADLDAEVGRSPPEGP